MQDQEETDGLRPWSISEILLFLKNLAVDPTRVRPEDIDFVYSTMFGVAWSDPEIEELRTEFLRAVDPDSARHLCKYILHHHPGDRFSDGFTDEDLDSLVSPLIVAVTLLLGHSELAPNALSFDVGITAGGLLIARPSRDATESATKDTSVHD